MKEKSGEEEVASIVLLPRVLLPDVISVVGFAFTSVVIELTVPGKKTTSQTSNKSSSGFNDHDIRAR